MLYAYLFLVGKGDVILSSYFSHHMMLLLVMVEHTPIFEIFIPTFLHSVLKTLIKVAYVEIFKNHYRSNYFKARR